jgi:hypothetical protein
MKKSEKGFSAIEGLLILVIVGLVGLVGWYVWSTRKSDSPVKDTAQPEQTASQSNKTDSCGTSIKERRTWKVASSSQGSFKLCVPGGWTLTSGVDSEEFEVFPPFTIKIEAEAVIKSESIPGRDGTGDIFQIFKADKNYQGWTADDAEKSTFTLDDGTKGIRYYTKYVDIVGEGIGPVEGEEDYEYLFEKNGKFIHAVYTIHPGTANHLETIEKVLKTLVIN